MGAGGVEGRTGSTGGGLVGVGLAVVVRPAMVVRVPVSFVVVIQGPPMMERGSGFWSCAAMLVVRTPMAV